MDWTVCSRETERDYTWDNAHASHPVAECARNLFAPAFEGSLTTSRFAALLRCPGSPSGVMLGVSVSTARKDFRDRPIRTMAFIRAETPDEAELLVVFFAACLRESDAKTLYDADSPLAKAIGNLYQAKKPNDFIEFCKGLSKVNGARTALTQRWSIPRDNIDDRKKVADVLSSLVGENESFLVVLTDRTPTDVLGSLGSMFDHATVRIFSKAVDHSENLPEPALQKYRRATAIGGVLAVAIIGLYFQWNQDKGGGGIKADGGTNATNSSSSGYAPCKPVQSPLTNDPPDGGEVPVTNSPIQYPPVPVHPAATNVRQQGATVTNTLSSHSGSGGGEDKGGGGIRADDGNSATNSSSSMYGPRGAVPPPPTNAPPAASEKSVTNSTIRHPPVSPVQPAATNVPQQEATVTNTLSSHSGSGGYVTPSTNTNVPQQEATVTKSFKTTPTRTEKREN